MKRLTLLSAIIGVAVLLFWRMGFDRQESPTPPKDPVALHTGTLAAAPSADVSAALHPADSVTQSMPSDASVAPDENAIRRLDPQTQLALSSSDRYADTVSIDQREEPSGTDGMVRRVRLVESGFKYPLIRIEDKLMDRGRGYAPIGLQTAMVADHVLVKVKPGLSEADVRGLASRHGGYVRRKLRAPDTYIVAFDQPDMDTVPRAVEALAGDKDAVIYVEPDYLIHPAIAASPNDPLFDRLWGLRNRGEDDGVEHADSGAAAAWNISRGSSNVLVAVLDTGIDYTHEDLAGNMWVNPAESGSLSTNGVDDSGSGFVDDWRGWNFYNINNDPMDDNGHGTHCAGTIGAVGHNAKGIAGVCWEISLVGLKIFGADGQRRISASHSDTIDAIYYGVEIGARVMSSSWSMSDFSQAMKDAITHADTMDVLFVAAAGNYSMDTDRGRGHYPASYDCANIISVASHDRHNNLSWFSNYGTNLVHLAAPGSDIWSTVPTLVNATGYTKYSGTSMATPHVSGAAALLLSHNPALSVAELKATLLNTVTTNAAYAGKVATGGRLNLGRAIRSLGGLYFDQWAYSPGDLAVVTLSNTHLAGLGTRTVALSSDQGDTESLVLHESSEPGLFTNSLTVAYSDPTPGNGLLEGLHGSMLSVTYTDAGMGITNQNTARLDTGLTITINPLSVLPPETGTVALTGINNGHAQVDMVVSNAATGDTQAFTASESAWTAPAVTLADGTNVITVSGVNTFGYTDSRSMDLIRSRIFYVNNASTNLNAWCTAPGNDTNDGRTPSTPKATVQAILAAYALNPGDIVRIDTGLEYSSVTVTNAYGTYAYPVIFEASPYGVTFDAKGGEAAWAVYSSYTTVRTARSSVHPDTPQRWMRVTGAERGVVISWIFVRLERIDIDGNDKVGVEIWAHKATVENCLIRNTAGSDGTGILMDGGLNTLRNCTLFGNVVAVDLWSGKGAVIQNNIVHADGGDRCVFRFNFPFDDSFSMFYPSISDYNNIYAVNEACLSTYHGPTLAEWRDATGLDANSLSMDPLFNDPANSPLHLQSVQGRYNDGIWVADTAHSPCIDAGDPSHAWANEPAPDGGRVNLGAYGNTELASQSPTNAIYTVEVVSPHGVAEPPVGRHTYYTGTDFECFLYGSPVSPGGGTQFVSVAGTVLGNDYTLGNPTNVTLTLTNDATLVWQWQTNFWLETSVASTGGQVTVGSGWQPSGVATALAAQASQYYYFTNWAGDVDGASVHLNPVVMLVDRPKSVTAHFAPNLTMNTGTPEYWLAQYGYTNFIVDAERDPLGKGMWLWQEYIAGTDPLNADDLFVLETIGSEETGATLTFSGRVGRIYAVFYQSELMNGSPWPVLGVHSNIPGSNAVVVIRDHDAALQPARYYRIGVQLNE